MTVYAFEVVVGAINWLYKNVVCGGTRLKSIAPDKAFFPAASEKAYV